MLRRNALRAPPGRPMCGVLNAFRIVLERAEELLPSGLDASGILLKARIEVLDVLRIAAIEERAAGEGCVGVLARHKAIVLSVAPDRRPRAGRTQCGTPYTMYAASAWRAKCGAWLA